jgi:two-component system sensor histidine kinase YesM
MKRFSSLQVKLLVILIIFNTSILVLLSSTFYNRSSAILIDKEKEKNKAELHQIQRNIDKFVNNLDVVSKEFAYSQIVLDTLKDAKQNQTVDLDRQRMLYSAMTKLIINYNDIISSIDLYALTGSYFYEGSPIASAKSRNYTELLDSPFFNEIREGNGRMVIGSFDQLTNTFEVGRIVNNLEEFSNAGLLIFHIRFSAVQAYYNEINTPQLSKILLFDQNRNIMSTGEKLSVNAIDLNFSQEIEIKDTKYLVSSEVVPSTKWKIVKLTSFQSILESTQVMKQTTWLYIVIFFIFFIVLSVYISRWISRPLNLLAKLMKKSLDERFLIKSPYEGRDEIGQLSQSYNQMMNEIHDLINNEYKLNLLNKEMELSSLQAQINPHFIYNTLDTINWASRANGLVEVSELSESLGKLLRVAIRNEDKNYTIQDELEYISNYMSIQKYRFEERIQIDIDANPAILHVPIPKLIIQPLLENAIVHNVDQNPSPTVISLKLHVDEDNTHVIVKVMDNGMGIPDPYIKQFEHPESESQSHFPHGLANVHRRLMLSNGPSYGLHIITSSEGTIITFKILIREKEEIQHGIQAIDLR